MNAPITWHWSLPFPSFGVLVVSLLPLLMRYITNMMLPSPLVKGTLNTGYVYLYLYS